MWDGCATLAQMFAPGSFDQTVDAVVGIVVARLDALVLKVASLLRVVLDVSDVAHRVVGVVQVLHLAARPASGRGLRAVIWEGGCVSLGEQMDQTEGKRVVVVEGADAILVVDAF